MRLGDHGLAVERGGNDLLRLGQKRVRLGFSFFSQVFKVDM
jgi:hypothetical protein